LNAFLCLIGIAAIAIFALPYSIGSYGFRVDVGAVFGMSIGIFFLVGFIGLSIAGGIGLLKGKNWGRLLSIVNAALSLLSFPIGTVIGILVLVYLARSGVQQYFEGTD